MTAKIHIRATAPTAANLYSLCASKPSSDGRVQANSRATYRFMSSEIVSMREAATLDPNTLCAHCVEMALEFRNRMRKARNMPPITDWRIYE
jgi:hypothetical protein